MHTGARCGKVHMDLNSDISEYTVARCGDINSGVSKSSHWPNQWSAWGGGRVLNMYIHPSLQHFADTTLHIIFRWSSLHDVTLHHTVVGWAPPTHCEVSQICRILYIVMATQTFGEMMSSTVAETSVSKTWALVSFLSQWAASHTLASGPFLANT